LKIIIVFQFLATLALAYFEYAFIRRSFSSNDLFSSTLIGILSVHYYGISFYKVDIIIVVDPYNILEATLSLDKLVTLKAYPP
jgi:hypothetical protein